MDLEHNTLSIDTCCQICISAQQIGITPLVRVPANTPEYICRVLDGGAMGVITPHIRSAAEARAMVELVKFPPLGHRSAGGALSHYQYRSFPMAETNAAMNDATSLVVMMETVAALENVEEIIATEGVDMLLIGSNDLCGEMGITGQYDHPSLNDAFARSIEAAAQGRQTCRHRRPGIARRPDDPIRADGRAICFNRNGFVVSYVHLCTKGAPRAGDEAVRFASLHTKRETHHTYLRCTDITAHPHSPGHLRTVQRRRTAMPATASLKEVYIDEMRDLWSANDQMQRVMKTLSQKASDKKLKDLLEKSVSGIEKHTEALRSVLEGQGGRVRKEHCKGMEGLVEEAKTHVLEEDLEAPLRDLVIISQYQRMSHYGLAGFGTAAAYAAALGLKDDATKLKSIVKDIYNADEYTNQLAERAEKAVA